MTLARTIKRIRPELDIYLLTDRQVEKLAGDPAASMIRRVFYEVEELTEVHLNILEGVATALPRRTSTTSSATPRGRSAPSTRCRSRAASRS